MLASACEGRCVFAGICTVVGADLAHPWRASLEYLSSPLTSSAPFALQPPRWEGFGSRDVLGIRVAWEVSRDEWMRSANVSLGEERRREKGGELNERRAGYESKGERRKKKRCMGVCTPAFSLASLSV